MATAFFFAGAFLATAFFFAGAFLATAFFFAGAFLAAAFLAAGFLAVAFLAAGFRLAIVIRILVKCRDEYCRNRLGTGSYQTSVLGASADFSFRQAQWLAPSFEVTELLGRF